MARTLTLDGLRRGGLNIFKEDGALKVEANYYILSGTEEIRGVYRDITPHLSQAVRAAISDGYDAVFSRIQQMELSE